MVLTVIDLDEGGRLCEELMSRDGDDEMTCFKVMLGMSLKERIAGGGGEVFVEDYAGDVDGQPAIVCGYFTATGEKKALVAVAPITGEEWLALFAPKKRGRL